MVWNSLALDTGFLGLSGLLPLIRQACEEDLCDPGYVGLREVERESEHGGKDDWRNDCKPIDNVLMEIDWCCCFSENDIDRPRAPSRDMPRPTGKPVMPPPSPNHGLGRNDPCPCGSGKKFKNATARSGDVFLAGASARPATGSASVSVAGIPVVLRKSGWRSGR